MKGQNTQEPYEYQFISYDYSNSHTPRFRDFMANNKFVKINNKLSIDYYNKNYDEGRNKLLLESYSDINSDDMLNSFLKIDHTIPLFYLNLETKKETRKKIENLIGYLGFKSTRRFRTINTNTLKKIAKYEKIIDKNLYIKILENSKNNITDSKLVKIEYIGIYLSYYKLFHYIVEKNIPLSFIIRDTFEIQSNKEFFWKICKRIIIPHDTDILVINSVLGENFEPEINVSENVINMECLLVTKKGAEKLIELLIPIKQSIEKELSKLSCDKKINLYDLSVPNL